MGRKKGRQCGEFDSKAQNAVHRHTVYVDRASEAAKYRNPSQIGSGYGYRVELHSNNTNGYWHSNGSAYGGGDKWSSIFSSSRSSNSTTHRSGAAAEVMPTHSNTNYAMGLSHLRHLLEERRSEDRVHDRHHRLRLQRSRMLVESYNNDGIANNRTRGKSSTASTSTNPRQDRHEPGWLLSYDIEQTQHTHLQQQQSCNKPNDDIPTLQQLCAAELGPILPMYCAAIGSVFVGGALKSVSAEILSDLAVSLATSSNDFATTDGSVKALVNSGVATGLVLTGAPLSFDDIILNEEEDDNKIDDDTRLLSDSGLLSLCPRILPTENYNTSACISDGDNDNSSQEGDWEQIDFDMGLNSRMTGCFHLKRLELINIPLRPYESTSHSGGISIQALRSVLKACSNITHLSLSGCFYNWETLPSLVEESDDINLFISGNPTLTSVANAFKLLRRHNHANEKDTQLLLQVMFHRMFDDRQDGISGLDEVLPELKVLDVSHCSWVTPGMIIQFLLKQWERAILSIDEVDNVSSHDDSEWDKHAGGDAASIRKVGTTKVGISLEHLNMRGCVGLLPEHLHFQQWIEEWTGRGLFNGIDVSTERHARR